MMESRIDRSNDILFGDRTSHYDENNLVSTLNHIETWIRMSGFPYKVEVDEDKELYSYVIQHDMGKKFSVLLAARARVIL